MAELNNNQPAPTQNPLAGLDMGSISSIQKGLLTILPDGHFKNELVNFWKNPNPVTGLKGILNLFKGRKYTTGQYTLGERLNDNVLGLPDIGNKEVTDELYEWARDFFTIVFGVRITTSEDLDALDKGLEAYYGRPQKWDIPPSAIKRAVYLKQNFFPISTYNKSVWDLREFANHPLVAPIPDPLKIGRVWQDSARGEFYNGPLPGGGEARNGIVMGSPVVKTGDDVINPVTGEKAKDMQPTSLTSGTSWLIAGLVVLGILGWLFFGKNKK